jgi:hypothetical protein
VGAIVVAHAGQLGWGRVVVDEEMVIPASQAPDLLRALPSVLSAQQAGVVSSPDPVSAHVA